MAGLSVTRIFRWGSTYVPPPWNLSTARSTPRPEPPVATGTLAGTDV
ncbi:hypothetical protein ABZ946_19940 [Streptomyces sp. NPDC046324]